MLKGLLSDAILRRLPMCKEWLAFTLALPVAVLLSITSFFQIGGGEEASLLDNRQREGEGEGGEADGDNVGRR